MTIETMESTDTILRYVAADHPRVWVRSTDIGIGASGREVAYYVDRRQNEDIHWSGGGPMDGITVEVFNQQRYANRYGVTCQLTMPDWSRREWAFTHEPGFETYADAEAFAITWIESATNLMHTTMTISDLTRASLADLFRRFTSRCEEMRMRDPGKT